MKGQEGKKKLIEMALPLSEINDASAYDKMPGIIQSLHPATYPAKLAR